MIVYPQGVGDTLQMAMWCAEKLGEPIDVFGFNHKGEPVFQSMGFARDNKLACVVVAYHATEDNIFCSFAATTPRWASKENIAAWGAWLFQQLGMKRVTATVKKGNKRSRKFVEGIGFRVEGKVRKAINGEDMIIYGLLKSEHEDWLRKAFKWDQKEAQG